MRLPEDLNDEVERRLKASAPRPRKEFVAGLEQELFREPAARRMPRSALAGAAFAACTGLLFLGSGLLGAGPLATDGESSARATDQCRVVSVTQRQRVPVLTQGAPGRSKLRYRTQITERQVERCP